MWLLLHYWSGVTEVLVKRAITASPMNGVREISSVSATRSPCVIHATKSFKAAYMWNIIEESFVSTYGNCIHIKKRDESSVVITHTAKYLSRGFFCEWEITKWPLVL